jgi:photosystem II stability/assembly factor-like uncharacterized protein
MKKIFYILILFTFTNVVQSQSKNWDILKVAIGDSIPAGVQVFTTSPMHNKDIIWLGLDQSHYATSSDGGKTWSAGKIGTIRARIVFQITGIDANRAIAIVSEPTGANYEVLITKNKGKTWTFLGDVFSGPMSFVNGSIFFNEKEGITLGDPESGFLEIFRTTDGGDTWTRLPKEKIIGVPSGQAPILNPDNVSLVGNFGATGSKEGLIYTEDKGLTIRKMDNKRIGSNCVFTQASDANNIFSAGVDAANLPFEIYTTDKGATWKDLPKIESFGVKIISAIPKSKGGYFISGTTPDFSKYNEAYTLDNFKTIVLNDNKINFAQPPNLILTKWFDTNNGFIYNRTNADGSYIFASKWKGGVLTDTKDQAFEKEALNIYPNPSNGMNIYLGGKSPQLVKVIDLVGNQVATINNPGNEINLPNLATGMYNLQLVENEKTYSQMIIINK